MKRLFLIRHAKSSWNHPELADIDRPLNKRGKRDAPVMGARLRKHKVIPDMIYVSPAKRARKTAKQIALALGYPEDRIESRDGIYSSDMNSLMKIVRDSNDQINTLFLVGHNYVLTDFAEFLSSELFGNVPTCGIVGMSFTIDSWDQVQGGGGELLFFDYPKKGQGEG